MDARVSSTPPRTPEMVKAKKKLHNWRCCDVVDSSTPRNSWLMGKVVETLPDSSGTVRRAKIKTKTSILERPVNKLCLLQEAMSGEKIE